MKKEFYLLEMEHIKDWCVMVLDFVSVKNPAFRQFSEITKENLIKHYRDGHQRMYKGFQQSYRDINEMANALPPLDFKSLNILLYERFGKDLSSANKTIGNRIGKILKKGKISTEEEYELVLNRVEEIYADASKVDEVKELNELLVGFDKK